MATRHDVAYVAQRAVLQRKAGDERWTHNGVTFNLDETGMCARFVKRCHAAAMGIDPDDWQFSAPNARIMEAKLKAAGTEVSEPQPGDIVALNNQTAANGHIAIYLWDEVHGSRIAENTISGTRGDPREPGTKISPFSAVETKVSGFYSPLSFGVDG